MAKNGLNKNDLNKEQTCILEENKICDNCCECFICELDPTKICDNCAKCLGVNELDEVNQFEYFIFDDDDFEDEGEEGSD